MANLTSENSPRLSSIDSLRGLVMVIMTLDHTRDFFSNARVKPTDLDHSWPALFLTRWITHYCAPVFVFLAGVSAYLWWQKRAGDHAALQRFLVERGSLILLLTLTVEAFSWNFSHDFSQIDGGVLWAIGWAMLFLAAVCRLSMHWLLAIAGLMIVGHNALDAIKPADLGLWGNSWAVLHTGDKFQLTDGLTLNPYYPLIPWLGVMVLGFVFGQRLSQSQWRSPQNLMRWGLAVIAGFIVLRYSNLYGDPQPWQSYPDPLFSLLSFINCHKYPPSLLYLMMTLGPALVLLGWFQALPAQRFAGFQVFGRTPLLFYLLHLYLIHGLAVLLVWINDGPLQAILSGGIWQAQLPADYGYDLPGVYGVWLLMVIVLFPICLNFERLKQRKPHWRWLKYF